MLRSFTTYPPRLKPASLILLIALLSACETSDKSVGELNKFAWAAAIGRLTAKDNACSATLIKPDLILTASHCLYGGGNEARITDFTFMPAIDVDNEDDEEIEPVKVTEVVAMGWPIRPDNSGQLRGSPKDDWAALRISPPIDSIMPLAIEKLGVEAIYQRMQKGAKLSHGGYGIHNASAKKSLQMRENCKLIRDAEEILATGHDVVVSSCRVIPGDSGGPIILSDLDGAHYIVGVVTNFWGAQGGKDFSSFGPASIYFADKLTSDATTTSAQ